jgi:integrase
MPFGPPCYPERIQATARTTSRGSTLYFIYFSNFLALREKLPDYLKPVVTLTYSTGWRKEEILGLRWNQVDLREGIVRLEPGETKNE